MSILECKVEIYPLPAGIVVEKDIIVAMPDGARLALNVYRPDRPGRFPVIMSFSPYGKDESPQVWADKMRSFYENGLNIGRLRVSEATPFEAPDSGFWVPHGYAVVHVDVRGFEKSEGERGSLRNWSRKEIRDYYDLIEWAGGQSWSSGNVGLSGVSYLAISQYYAASTRPPHLKAISPWEGFSDPYRDTCFPGGIPESNFHLYWEKRYLGKQFDETALAEFLDPVANQAMLETAPELEKIETPALICASWSDQGLHSRGGFEAFRRISSADRWLYTHGRRKWEEYYSEEALEYQKKFFDCFLKGSESWMTGEPRVHLETRQTLDEYTVRHEQEWPPARTWYRKLYLDSERGTLNSGRAMRTGKLVYDSNNGQAVFDITFKEDTELSGYMKLKLWVSTGESDDMDLFVCIKKLDAGGNEVNFYGMNGYPGGAVARGWLRVSQRETDEEMSAPYRPFLKHRGEKRLSPGDIVPVEIEILPSSTLFRGGESLRLVVRGKDIMSHPMIKYERLVNTGMHAIYTGSEYDSYLMIPVVS